MMSLADAERIISATEPKAELIGQPRNIAVEYDGANLVAHVRMDVGWTHWLISAFVALFAASALFGQQAQFQGSVPTGVASPTPVTLTLRDAIDRGLKTNLGLLLSGQVSEIARGERLRSLSALLPQVTGEVSENVEQIDLPSHGIDFHLPGGFTTPTVVGPFHYTDARAYASFSVFDYSLRKSYRAAQEGERAAQLSFKDARDLVVQSVANAYLARDCRFFPGASLTGAGGNRPGHLRPHRRPAPRREPRRRLMYLRAQSRAAAGTTATDRAEQSGRQRQVGFGTGDRPAAGPRAYDRRYRALLAAGCDDSG